MIKKYLILLKNLRKYINNLLKLINFDVSKENIKKHNQNWAQIPDHTYRILIIRGSGLKKKKQQSYLI